MLGRCYRPSNISYRQYGGRGIAVCDRWRHSFDNFLADMGPRPAGHELDRIDSNGPYAPENCRWATRHQQTRNTRRTVNVTFRGETKCLQDWSQHFGIPFKTLSRRLGRKLPIEQVFS